METTPAFKLSGALDAWRASLSAVPPDDLAELESHLLDSMAELQKSGLTEEEAFLIARRRLGRAEDMADLSALPAWSGGSPGPSSVRAGSPRRKRAGCILVWSGLLATLAAIVLLVLDGLMPKRYTADVIMEVARPIEFTGLDSFKAVGRPAGLAGSNGEFSLSTQIELMRTNEVLSEVVRSLDLTKRWKLSDPAQAIARLGRMVRIDLLRDATLIRLAVTSTDNREAAEIANEMADAYIQRRSVLDDETASRFLQNLTMVRDNQAQVVERARNSMIVLVEELEIVDLKDLDVEGSPFSAERGNDGPPLSPEKYLLYSNAKADWLHQQEVLRAMTEELEIALQIGRMPRRAVTFLQRATESPDDGYGGYSRYWFWRPVAIASAGVGGFLLVLGWVLKRRANRPMLLP